MIFPNFYPFSHTVKMPKVLIVVYENENILLGHVLPI